MYAPATNSCVLLYCCMWLLLLHVQLCYIVRLLDVKAALDTLPDKQRRAAAQQQLSSSAVVGAGGSSSSSGSVVVSALNHAAGLVAKLRDSSGYRWVDLGAVFSRMRTGRNRTNRGAGAGGAGSRGAAVSAGFSPRV